ncbi:initiator tRNA phosphoribosyl transferase [Artomyces pyxidatus]|uniref:Initiator tRNA phosphoribosyl transferase n=1 Tax=Artomyces pyxidatus TaxID=48021 RepID=A0ACB8TGM4_9AGAM|nr:initiator tRNA phosphoribosyl transferase [Artomyces pyxidatus]
MRDSNSEALAYLRKESLDLYNRLHSIEEDIAFVDQVREFYDAKALLPNLRCGAWYTDPTLSRSEPAYFKSTDGHYGNWGFNLRRPNMHLTPVALEHDGLILVDSTRAGKRIPDALSKTVPIWCAVVNRALLLRGSVADPSMWDSAFYTPPAVVSAQEHQQIEARLQGWAEDLASSSYHITHLPRPLRPFWITPATTHFPVLAEAANSCIPIICVSASRQVNEGDGRRSHGFAYVQGSGDDHELWGMGLTPDMFWRHRERLMQCDRAGLENLVRSIVSSPRHTRRIGALPTPVTKVAGRLLLCSLGDSPPPVPDFSGTQAYIHLGPSLRDSGSSETASGADDDKNYRILRLPLTSGKKGQYQFLRGVLPRCVEFARFHLEKGACLCVACESGNDASVGVVLALLQLFFNDDGNFVAQEGAAGDGILLSAKKPAHVDKKSIRTRLQWIISSRPTANPSRTTLKRVNDFLLSIPRPSATSRQQIL